MSDHQQTKHDASQEKMHYKKHVFALEIFDEFLLDVEKIFYPFV